MEDQKEGMKVEIKISIKIPCIILYIYRVCEGRLENIRCDNMGDREYRNTED